MQWRAEVYRGCSGMQEEGRSKLPPESQGTTVDFTCLLKNAISPIHVNSIQPNCTGTLAHWSQVKLCCSGKNTSTCATETAHWADKVLPKTCKMGHKVQPQQNVSHEGMVKMRITRVNMAS